MHENMLGVAEQTWSAVGRVDVQPVGSVSCHCSQHCSNLLSGPLTVARVT